VGVGDPWRRLICTFLKWLVRAACATAIVMALAAGNTGLDADQRWGPFRQALLAIGVAGILIPLASRAITSLDRRLIRAASAMTESSRAAETEGLRKRTNEALSLPEPSEPLAQLKLSSTDVFRTSKSRFLHVAVLLAISTLYVWFVSVGQMTWWPPTTDYYSLLTEAFVSGRTDLLIEPPPQLSQLSDPYSQSIRQNIPLFRKDLSLYQGRFFVYWGPVPAILAAPIRVIFGRSLGDQHITFAASVVGLVFMSLILGHIERTWFPSLPRWLILGGLLVIATAHPTLWMLSWGAVYAAAITSGQAFLMGGLFFALPVIDGSGQQKWRLVAAGASWVLSAGSRLNLVGPVMILAIVTLGSLILSPESRRQKAFHLAAPLLVPLGVGAILLGLYNYVRFGSPFETGLRYQLTSAEPYHLIERGELFSSSYLAPNLLYHLAAPIRFGHVFPFMKPVRGPLPSFGMFLARLNVPKPYSVEDITGLLVAVPFVLFGGVLAVQVVCGRAIDWDAVDGALPRLAWGLLLAAAAAAAAPVLLYYMVASRFLLDYSPLLMIASVIGSWLLFSFSQRFPVRRTLVSMIIAATIIYSIVAGVLLAVSGPASLFDDYNPRLWEILVSLTSN
jgi:hypothetical protein